MANTEKPRTKLGAKEKDLLKRLYDSHATVQVDDLPYTEDIERIRLSFNTATGRTLAEGDVHKALKNLGRGGELGGKFRKK